MLNEIVIDRLSFSSLEEKERGEEEEEGLRRGFWCGELGDRPWFRSTTCQFLEPLTSPGFLLLNVDAHVEVGFLLLNVDAVLGRPGRPSFLMSDYLLPVV